MFGELRKLRTLGALVRKGHHQQVLALAQDSSIANHKKAVDAAAGACAALISEAKRLSEDNQLSAAYAAVRLVLDFSKCPEAQRTEAQLLSRKIQDALAHISDRKKAFALELARARRMAREGDGEEAVARLVELQTTYPEAAEAVAELRAELGALKVAQAKIAAQLKGGDFISAADAWQALGARPVGVHAGHDELWTRLLSGIPKFSKKAKARRDFECVMAVLKPKSRTPQWVSGANAVQKDHQARSGIALLSKLRQLFDSDRESFAALLSCFPLGMAGDDTAGDWARGLRLLERGERLSAQGSDLADGTLAEAARLLPDSSSVKAIRKGHTERLRESQTALLSARSALDSGKHLEARERLIALLEKQPEHAEAKSLLDSLGLQDQDDQMLLNQAQAALQRGSAAELHRGMEILQALVARRPDLTSAALLMRDLKRRLRALGETPAPVAMPQALASKGDGGARSASTMQSPRRGATRSAAPDVGNRPVLFKDVENLDGSGELVPGLPFILRVEESGDWFVHPGRTLTIGNASRGVADLPVLASIASRHGALERVGDGQHVAYRFTPEPNRPVLRNRKPVKAPFTLAHGDVVTLGRALSFTFRRPIADNGSAVVEWGGDFTTHGCRRVLLFAESGRSGSLVIGPGPEAHVALGRDGVRAEILRGCGTQDGALLVRSRRGVAVGDDVERPQARLRPGCSIRCEHLRFFVDVA